MAGPMDADSYLNQLESFASVAWGNPQAFVKRLPHRDVEYIDLSEFVDAFKHFTAGILKGAKILIRDEYRTALQALSTHRYQCGAYVLGQPGIGKTYFLIYLLVQFLGNKQPVAMQPLGGASFYMLFQDSVTVHSLSIVHPYSTADSLLPEAPLLKCKFVWALCDSNSNMTTPNSVFHSDPDRIRIIQATFPQESHYRGWSEQIEAQPYIMDIWTEEEIESLAILLGKDCKRMISLAEKWGAAPRTILRCIKDEDQNIDIGEAFLEHCDEAIRRCQQIEGPQLDGSGPSYFFFYRPERLATGETDRKHHSISVPTQTLCDFLAQGLAEKYNSTKIQFYRTLSGIPGTRQAAGQVYESWFHRFFTSTINLGIQYHWVEQGSDNGTLQLPPTLGGIPFLVQATYEGLKNQMPPYYWVPPNFPGIDSILVLEDQAFAFQVIVGWRHTSPIGGLQTLGEWSPELRKLDWTMVFIGPEPEPIQQVASSWVNRVWFPTNEELVPVAWSVVDPVHPGIDCESYDDESNEEMGEFEGE